MTVTWIQLNSQLLRLTGDARYGNELERSYYNHLAAAQRPDGAQWCYYTALEGTKPYGPGINCCVSSGPRGMALAPQLAYLKTTVTGPPFPAGARAEAIAVNLFEASTMTTTLGGHQVTLEQATDFPRAAGSKLTFKMERPTKFALQVRAPVWARPLKLQAGNETVMVHEGGSDWATLPPRTWRNGDRVVISFNLPARVTPGTFGNDGRACLRWGPLVLAYDAIRNPGLPPAGALGLIEDKSAFTMKSPMVFEAKLRSARDATPRTALFVPFAEAGADGDRYQIWLRAPGAEFARNDSLFAFGNESRSRAGNVNGSIGDGNSATFVVTFNARRADEDWFAITVDSPVTIKRVVYAHGHNFHDGGWFDASAGKPRVQIQREKNGAWETIGTLDEYPAATAIDHKGLKNGQKFTLRLKEAVKCVAVRVLGKPAHGDNATQAFSSCAELEAFPK